MLNTILSYISLSINTAYSWLISFINADLLIFILCVFSFYSLYRFILRPLLGGSALSDTVNKREK